MRRSAVRRLPDDSDIVLTDSARAYLAAFDLMLRGTVNGNQTEMERGQDRMDSSFALMRLERGIDGTA